MPVGRSGGIEKPGSFGRYPPFSFSLIPRGVVEALVSKHVGRNGWAVMAALCRRVYADGKLGRSSQRMISEFAGLSVWQVARGMTELRDKGIIVPVVRKDVEGRRWVDRSVKGYVAQYCIDRSIWATVELLEEEQNDSSGGW